MKTLIEEIIKGLELCMGDVPFDTLQCDEKCPYYGKGNDEMRCDTMLYRDAAEILKTFFRIESLDCSGTVKVKMPSNSVTKKQFCKLVQVLYDNNIDSDECSTVAEAVCYVLDLDMDSELKSTLISTDIKPKRQEAHTAY